jgi:hypothetical protein
MRLRLAAHRQSLEAFMEDEVLDSSAVSTTSSSTSIRAREGRGVWVLTAYGISGLVLFGVLIYYFSTYVTH